MDTLHENLIKIGMSANEAKVLQILFISGPSGASDIHSKSGVPRNKIYEILNRLAERGIVETQPGRPTLFRASNPEAAIEAYIDNYREAGNEVVKFLHNLKKSDDESESAAFAWVVKGREQSKRRLSELLYGAKTDVFMISSFPSEYLEHASSAIKAAEGRGIHARAVCMVRPMETMSKGVGKNASVEYRTIKDFSKLADQIDPHDMKIMGGFRDTSSYGGVAIIDEELAFNIVDDGRLAESVTGILIKAPGVPRIQKGTIERILSRYTRKL